MADRYYDGDIERSDEIQGFFVRTALRGKANELPKEWRDWLGRMFPDGVKLVDIEHFRKNGHKKHVVVKSLSDTMEAAGLRIGDQIVSLYEVEVEPVVHYMAIGLRIYFTPTRVIYVRDGEYHQVEFRVIGGAHPHLRDA